MKRRRPEPWVMRNIRLRAYFGKVVPPLTVVRSLATWRDDQDRIFRVGYYSRQDGLDCVWLVNETGEYEQTTDQKSIETEYEILSVSGETDLYGVDREVLGIMSDAEFVKPEVVQSS